MDRPEDSQPPLLAPLSGRRTFLTGSLAAAASGLLVAGAPIFGSERACCPQRLAAFQAAPVPSARDLAAGNAQAMALAQRSVRVMQGHEATLALAANIPDATLRQATLALLRNPAPTYQLRSPSPADRLAVRQELLAAGLITEANTVEGIFPPVLDPHEAPQAFWSAPGAGYAGHHPFPGGLMYHEWVNTLVAQQWLDAYDAAYGLVSDSKALDVSITLAAPLWHDIHKATVFQWMPDGSLLLEQPIADTGGHHPLSGAEAIVRSLPNDFVVALLSAHDPPSTARSNPNQTGLQRLVNYIRAAAIIARVDPVVTGLLRRTDAGELALAQVPPRAEGQINHLSDHDFIFSGDSASLLISSLQQLAPRYGIASSADPPRFNLFRNLVLSQAPDMLLYGVLQTGGLDGLKATIDDLDLSQLAAASK
jgi:hypothetical protein